MPSQYRFKVDEDLTGDIAELLRNHGVDAVTVHDQGWDGKKDEQLIPLLYLEGRILITCDKDIGNVRRFPPRRQVA